MTTSPVAITVDFSQVTALANRLVRVQATMERELEVTMHRVVLKAEHDAKADAKHDTGDLRRRITSSVEHIPGGVLGKVGSNAPHAGAIEEGRTAGKKMPPPGALLGWMARHGIPVSDRKITGTRRIRNADGKVVGFSTRKVRSRNNGTKGYYPNEFLIARKIGKKGFTGDHNMQKAVLGVRDYAHAEFSRVGPKVIRQIVKGAG